MSYRATRSDQVVGQLARLPRPVIDAVESQIHLLEQNPRLHSRPAFVPLPTGQVSQLDYTFQGMDYLVDIVFRYGADEETLHLEYLFVETM